MFFTFVLVFVIKAKGDEKMYLYERIVAENKIEIKGGRSNLKLKLLDDYPELCIFEDAENKCFAIVAKKKYERVLDDLVLAYGFENGFVRENISIPGREGCAGQGQRGKDRRPAGRSCC